MRPLLFVDPEAAGHHPGRGHPERPERIQACLDALARSGLEVERAEPAEAAREDLERVHEPAYLDRLERFCRAGGGALDPDTAAGPRSFEIAARASGAACAAAGAALAGGRRSFCLVRPPGHHATSARAMGFCLVNNAAVAVRHAQALGAGRVAVVDVDVHHGNGTQDVFWEDPSVLYLSLHQYPWYPGTGALEETGSGPGAGATVNVPLPAGAGDPTYLASVERVAVPVLRRFGPDVLVVSVGFDAHTRDPLAQMEVTAGGYGRIAALLVGAADELCGGRIVMTLEGGYDLEGLSSSFVATMRALDGREAPAATGDELPDAASALDQVIEHHRERWGLG